MKGRSLIAYGASCAAMLAGFSGSAVAQEAEATAQVDDIVVTAQRREQRLQDVPIAVTAMNAEALANSGASDLMALTAMAPGLQINHTTNIAQVYLRGVGTDILSIGAEPSVATYLDGVYMPSAYGGNESLPDIARVEVLRGPQGTLFGRNATGGVINITTRVPSPEFEYDASLGVSSFDTATGSLYVTGGLTDNLAASLTAYVQDQGEGWGTNITTGNDIYLADSQLYRTRWRLDLGPGTSLDASIGYNRWIGDIGVDRGTLPGTLALNGVPPFGHFTMANTFDSSQDMRRGSASVEFQHDLGFANLVAIASVQQVKNVVRFDQDGTPAPIIEFIGRNTTQDTETLELQLQSPSDSNLQWILGGYYYHDLSGYDSLLVRNIFQTFVEGEADSYAVFGQATYPITDALRATLGLRYTDDTRTRVGEQFSHPSGVLQASVDQEEDFSKLTWRASLDFDIAPDVLGYVSYNRGFKSGLYNLVTLAGVAVRPEVLDAYEIGVKSDLFDRRLRLNASAYFYEYTDIQTNQFFPGGSLLFNAAAAEMYGFEIEGEAILSPEFRLQGGLSWQHSEYTEFPDAPLFTPRVAAPWGNVQTSFDASGNELVRAPELTVNIGPSYETDLANGTFFASGNVYYNSGFFWFPDNRVEQEAYTTVNARMGWRSSDDRWEVFLWGRNITDEEYYIVMSESTFGDQGSPAAPATYGITLRLRGGAE